jgi:hypothetical protein
MDINFKVPSNFINAIRSKTHNVQLRIFKMVNGYPIIDYPSYFEVIFEDQLIGLNVSLIHIKISLFFRVE